MAEGRLRAAAARCCQMYALTSRPHTVTNCPCMPLLACSFIAGTPVTAVSLTRSTTNAATYRSHQEVRVQPRRWRSQRRRQRRQCVLERGIGDRTKPQAALGVTGSPTSWRAPPAAAPAAAPAGGSRQSLAGCHAGATTGAGTSSGSEESPMHAASSTNRRRASAATAAAVDASSNGSCVGGATSLRGANSAADASARKWHRATVCSLFFGAVATAVEPVVWKAHVTARPGHQALWSRRRWRQHRRRLGSLPPPRKRV